MFKRLLATDDAFAPLILRLGLAVAMFPHGAQKVLGIWGGHGLSATFEMFSKMGIPAWLTALDVLAEFAAPIALVFGLLTRLSALGIGIMIAVAAFMVHVQNGFFMNWTGAQKGEGFEYHILVFVIAAALVVSGGGKASLDRAISGEAAKGEVIKAR